MRKLTLVGLAIAAAVAAAPSTGNAQNHAWCLVNDLELGSTSRAFVSRERCIVSVGGNVENGIANPAYAAARAPPHKPHRSDR
jgi:Protein of unknown function (DUF3551)